MGQLSDYHDDLMVSWWVCHCHQSPGHSVCQFSHCLLHVAGNSNWHSDTVMHFAIIVYWHYFQYLSTWTTQSGLVGIYIESGTLLNHWLWAQKQIANLRASLDDRKNWLVKNWATEKLPNCGWVDLVDFHPPKDHIFRICWLYWTNGLDKTNSHNTITVYVNNKHG